MAYAHSTAVICRFESRDVEFAHLEQGLHRSCGASRVRSTQELRKPSGNDLPREAVTILEPAAAAVFAASAELFPQSIDLPLICAIDGQGNRLAELEIRTTIERKELSAGKFKAH